MGTIKAMKWATKTKEEKDQIIMKLRIKEALRKHSDFTIPQINEMVKSDILNLDRMEIGKRFMIMHTALTNEGFDVYKANEIIFTAFGL